MVVFILRSVNESRKCLTSVSKTGLADIGHYTKIFIGWHCT